MNNDFEVLENNLGYKFKDIKLLKNALCHKSYINETADKSIKSYERLEFLGDSVLGVIVSRYIYDNFTSFPEGKLSKLRASVVCEESLAAAARCLDIGEYIILSRGESASGGSDKDAILCDVFEAVIAAVYIDGGIEQARAFVMRTLKDAIDEHARFHSENDDCKTTLQELVQSRGKILTYRILSESGPDHEKLYTAGAFVDDKLVAEGTGSSKKKAQQNAAREALKNKI